MSRWVSFRLCWFPKGPLGCVTFYGVSNGNSVLYADTPAMKFVPLVALDKDIGPITLSFGLAFDRDAIRQIIFDMPYDHPKP